MTVMAWVLFVLAMVMVPISIWGTLAALGLCVGCTMIRDWNRTRRAKADGGNRGSM
ncbi:MULTISPECIES: hypothetical protein [unclassified Thioalkalivibrio]|uniref:hypothetical protein n=1 Tax=unclassified Thioalkalivibrio TaxID=2621013 RepID=UPI0003799B50|nr:MULTISPECIES: hypothetical protein [unclassified Thioalkalivibrio]